MPSAPSNYVESPLERELRELNAALVLSSVHQHELTEEAQRAEAESRKSEGVALLAHQAMEKTYLAVHASEQRYHSLFDSIDEGFCVIEMLFDSDNNPLDYRFLETNPAFEKQAGLHDAVGKCMRTLAPQHEAHWFERYGRVALTGESVRFVEPAHALGGRWFDVYAFRVGEPEHRRVAILFADITERRLLEEKTREQARALTDLNRRKDEFLAMLSHELRNPLAAISNASSLLRLQPDGNSVEAQNMIDRQVEKLTRLVDELLDISRISTGRIRLQMDSVAPVRSGPSRSREHSATSRPKGAISHARFASGISVRARRCRAAGAGRREPARQRTQIYQPRRADLGSATERV